MVSCNAIGVTAVELVNGIERHIFSRFRRSALRLAVGDRSPLGSEGREQQRVGGAWEGDTPGGVIGWGSGAGHDRWLMNSVMVDCSR
jgi:hypothetical protein